MSNCSKGIAIFLSGVCASLLLGLVLLPPMEIDSNFKFFTAMLPVGTTYLVLLHFLAADRR